MHYYLALVRLNVLYPALRTPVVAAAAPNISPLFPIIRAAVIINKLRFGHLTLPANQSKNYLARHWP